MLNKETFQQDAYFRLAPLASLSTRCKHCWGKGGLEINKFEQVCSDSHQMSLAGRSKYSEIPCPDGKGGGWGYLYSEVLGTKKVWGYGRLYSEVHCIIGNGQIGPPSSCEQNDGQIRLKTLPSCIFWLAVIREKNPSTSSNFLNCQLLRLANGFYSIGVRPTAAFRHY